MFEALEAYGRILVTGPHRSGTTFAAETIAKRLDYVAIRECDLATPRFPGDTEPALDAKTVAEFFRDNEKVVLQGATCYAWLSTLQFPDLATVYINRDHGEVVRSQIEYRGRQIDRPDRKLQQWNAGKKRFNFALTVNYADLEQEPEFVADRWGWSPRQTEE